MTVTSLTRGGNQELPAHVCRAGYLDVQAAWPLSAGADALDVAVVAATAAGKVRSDEDFIFFNQPKGLEGTVRHLGQGQAGSRAHDEVRLRLAAVPADIAALHIILSAAGGVIGPVPDVQVLLRDADQQTLLQLDMSGAGPEPALIAAEVYRRGDGWKVRCIGQGWDDGLAALARHFGISVDDDGSGDGSTSGSSSDESSHAHGGQDSGGPVRQPSTHPTATPTPTPTPTASPVTGQPVPPAAPSGGSMSRPVPSQPPAPTTPAVPPPGALQAVRSRWLGRRGRADAGDLAAQVRQQQAALEALAQENATLRADLQRLGAGDAAALVQEMTARRLEAAAQEAALQRRIHAARQELEVITRDLTAAEFDLAQVRATLIATDEEAVLQEVGVYRYAHPLQDAVAYKARLVDLKDRIKVAVRADQAVLATTNWQVNGSSRDGAKMVKETSKLMLRAFNAEADNCVRVVRPHTVHTAVQRLEKAAQTIARLGTMMSIRVSEHYLRLRLEEIRLTADYLAKVEEERERAREAREQAREEAKAAAEFEREKARLLKEQGHYEGALERARASDASPVVIAEIEAKIENVQQAISGVNTREANLRAGHVYVISNIGAFGERMVKIGMTRRLEPMDRVRELGDASVPFRFDVHALIRSDDAVALESKLHAAFADQRVNRVNKHREFFYVTPVQVRDQLAQIAGQHLLEFHELPEALEWRASGAHATRTPSRAK
ncbi:DUF4041 domain-containing protein [Kineococcus sp. SYSU DK006]|uniref:DUF4041 domain-containing protein n=1 Tax=Kineococcus sp. SYSU DK006 TaxID=3383127 RepID=UPI003D7ED50D